MYFLLIAERKSAKNPNNYIRIFLENSFLNQDKSVFN